MGFCRETLEPEYIMATAMQYKLKYNSLFSHDTIGEWPEISQHEFRVNGYPQEHGNGSYHYPFYQLCQQNGIGILFSGFGGDEVVTNPSTKQVRLELADQHSWKALLAMMPGQHPIKLARLVKNIYHANAEMPTSNSWLLNIWKARWPYQFLRQEVLNQYALEDAYFATATYDERFRKINEASIYLINRSFAPTRLENCSLMAASFGVEYVWPLLDQRLVQQWLSTPAIWKVGDGGISRYLHRRAVADVCHSKVAWKPCKDMGFDEVQKRMNTDDNRPTLNKLLAELEGLNPAILDLVDVSRLQDMAIRGIKEDWRGSEIKFALDENLLRLENMNRWLMDTD
jgi:asparagine synthase (glutamine-hydrolysing)